MTKQPMTAATMTIMSTTTARTLFYGDAAEPTRWRMHKSSPSLNLPCELSKYIEIGATALFAQVSAMSQTMRMLLALH